MNPAADKCPKCGGALAGGLCRKCLLLAGLDPASAATSAREAPAATGSSGSTPLEKAGDIIGRYKLLQQIGEGGFGVVWMAEQEEPVRRRVALKVIKMGMDTKEVIARFEQEQQALAMMDHPNIAKVFDAGATKLGRPFFVMELIRGMRITEYCDQHHLPTSERLELFIAVCHAIQHAHQKGIIHRDLKPSNILVTLHDGTPTPKVIDFGVAKAMQQERLTDLTFFTRFEQMVGTPLYMSPEQAEMSGLDIDTRSDIYSLGVLLYELLTGRTPFDPKALMQQGVDEIRRTIREEEPPAPSIFVNSMAADLSTTVARNRQADAAKLVGEIRGDLDWIVMKALEKDRRRRYETANGLAKDLERHLASEPVHARPASRLYVLGRMVKRHRLPFAAAAAMAVALLLTLGILALSYVRIRDEEHQKGAALAAAKEQLFLALFNQARAGRFSGRMGQRLDSLEALAAAARIRPEERLRDEATVAMALPDVGLGPNWHFEPGEVLDESYRFSATPGAAGSIIVRSVPDRRELRRIESGHKTQGDLGFSRDGRFLAQYTTDGSWNIWRWEDGHSILGDGRPLGGAISFSPDDHHVAIPLGDFVIILSLDTGAEENRFRARALVHNLAFHPDSRRIAVAYDQSDITSIYDTADGKNLADLPVGVLVNQVTAWHPDGIRLAVAGMRPPIQIWDVEAKEKVAVLEGNSQEVDRLSFHPSGEMLASVGWESICRVWQPSSGRPLMQFPLRTPFLFSTDGRWLGAYGTGERGRLLEVASCPEYRTLENRRESSENPYRDGDVSPDGRLFALGMDDGVGLWSTSDWRQLGFLPIGHTSSVLFLPNGSELLTCGNSGLRRWPMEIDRQISSTIRLGPPMRIGLPFTPTRAARSQDGKTIAVISLSGGGAVLVDLSTGSVQSPLMRHDRGQFVALSAGGKWMASSAWGSYCVRLWDASSGKLVHEFPGENASIAFHNDGKTLFTVSYDGISCWDVASLKLLRTAHGDVETLQHHVTFSPDGKLVAVALTPTVIYLLDASNLRTVAKLEDPHGDRPTWIGFTPDGTRLLTADSVDRTLHVWDLRAIRARLKGMGLDWDWPEFPPAPAEADAHSPAANPVRSIEVMASPPGAAN